MKKILEINNLNKWYKNFQAVKELSFTVDEGQIFGLLGPNGAGKSTTIECILGTKKSKFDEVTILGMSLEKVKKDRKKQKTLFSNVGVQFQANFYPEYIRVNEMCEMIDSLYKKTNDWRMMLKNRPTALRVVRNCHKTDEVCI